MIDEALRKLAVRQHLSATESRATFAAVFAGGIAPEHIKALLLGLREKGETAEEIMGAALAMRAAMLPIAAPPEAVDIVGTGGDGLGTLNVSTAAAFVVAACGVPVAKHGNRAATSRSGSSDVLVALGVNLEPAWEVLERELREVGLAFLFAPRHHPALRQVAEVRRALGVRTIFNILGPLANPAQVKRHLIGVADPALLRPMAEVLKALGSESFWIVHGSAGEAAGGMDEISTLGPTSVVALENGTLRSFEIVPEMFGLPRASLSDICGGDASVNAQAIRRLFAGEQNPCRDIVLMNAAAALVIAQKAGDMTEALQTAAQALDSGAAQKKLDQLVRVSCGEG